MDFDVLTDRADPGLAKTKTVLAEVARLLSLPGKPTDLDADDPECDPHHLFDKSKCKPDLTAKHRCPTVGATLLHIAHAPRNGVDGK